MSLYHKYRPQTLDEVQGNEEAVDTLRGLLRRDDPPHAWLLHGPTGCGKTTLGRIIARELGCCGSDFREVDSADFRGIDTMREIRAQSAYKALEGPCRVWLIDECHKMTNDAQNAILKGLEDAPAHVHYVLCTTDPHKLLPTIRGRCAQAAAKPLGARDMMALLRRVVKAEGESLTKRVYEQIVDDSLGHPRNALQILDAMLATEPERRQEVARRAAEVSSQMIELCRALVSAGGWKLISSILKELKEQQEDAEAVRQQVLGYCSSYLLGKDTDAARPAAVVMEEFLERPFYGAGWPALVYACYSVVAGGHGEEDIPF